MQSNRKLAMLELIAGIFGWIWIVASIAGLYYLAMALFSDGVWSSFFWAFGTGAVAKWLSIGFDETKKRGVYEN
ncbi:MAG: hypothetical protein V7708_02785 [Oceanicoccus sp.]